MNQFIQDNLIIQILNFLYELCPSTFLKDFCKTHINSHHLQSLQFSYLEKIYNFRLDNFLILQIDKEKKFKNRNYYEDLLLHM